MKKILILAVACTMACLLHAQNPKSITIPKTTITHIDPSAPETPCNSFAGTFSLGQKGVITQSNDLTLDTIWLCSKDSIFLNHNGDFNLSGDPNTVTPAGVGFAFYTCPPTTSGPTLQDITGSALPMVTGDPCRLQDAGMPFDLLVTSDNANGDTWFFNSGFLQTTYNLGQPLLLHFAPITFDDAANNGYEPLIQGGPPGPCVNVNTAAEFEVVYLNPITAVGFTTPFSGNSCLGRFKLEGGYAEWDLTQKYDIDIYLKSDPTVKAVINNAEQQIKHGVSLIFSVPVAGVYVISVEDGKSCGLRQEVTMGSCVDSDNVRFILGNVEGAPGSTVCVPITVNNFSNIQGFATSIQWDPTLLQLQPGVFIQNINPDLLADFDPAAVGNVNTSEVGNGYLGLLYAGTNPATITATEVLMEVCFLVISQEDSICTPLNFINQPSSVSVTGASGASFAFEAVNGELCVVYDTISTLVNILVPNCDGTNNVEVTITGGEAPYELQWMRVNPVGGTSSVNGITAGVPFIIPNLIPGDYRLIVIPLDGFDPITLNYDTVYFTINASTLGAALDLSVLPSCNGDCDGTVTAIVFQGSTQVQPPYTGYTFSWAGTVPDPGMAVQNPVCSGAYTVTITQLSNGCTALAAGTLPNPPVLDNGLVTITQASCTGVADGTITYEIEGGTPNNLGQYSFVVTYSENPGEPNGSPADSGLGSAWLGIDLATGFYTIVITDSKGCTFTEEVFVPALRVVNLTENMSLYLEPACNGGNTGQLGVDVTITPAPPGGPNFTFAWVPGGTSVCTATSCTLSVITAGTYFVTALDNNGCSDTITLELNEPPVFTVSAISIVNPTCPNPTGGSINVSGFGGSGLPSSFTYSWVSSNGPLPNPNTANLSGLAQGTYTVTATDGNGCTAVLITTLALPAPPAITGVTQVDVRCGSDGSLTVNAPTAVSYNWTSSNGPLPNPNVAAINNLIGGTYTVVVTDALGCTNADTILLAGVEPLIFSDTTLNTPTCNGYNDGSIALGITGGNPGYTFNWDPASMPPNSAISLTLVAGVYSVTVTDTKQCTLVGEFTLTEPPLIQALVSEPTVTTTCFGSCDGTATLLVNYQPGTNFNFVWDNGSIDSLRTDLCTGLNTVTITETSPAQCFIVFDVTVGSPPEITADPTETVINPVSCFGDEDGSISVAVQGGNGSPYTFAWQTPVGATGAFIQNLMPGDYVATITDNQGCTTEYTATVGEPAPMIVSIDIANTLLISCAGEDDGKLAVITTGGNPANPGGVQYTYVWADAVNQIGTTNPLEMVGAGTYTVTVTDSKQCTGTSSLTLSDPPRVQGDYKLGAPLQCFGDETTIVIENIMGGQGAPYSYTIDFGVPLDPTFTSSITGGEHYITYIDKQNCETTDTIDVPEPPQIIVTFDSDLIEQVLNKYQLGDSLTITPLITGAVVDSFIWMPATFLKNPDTLQPILYTFESGNLMLTVYDDKGCMGKGTLQVEVDPNRNVYLPNVFIPGNSLGTNDFFTPFVGVGVENINYMRIYDRWGELMYGRDNFLPSDLELTSGWDGRFKGKFVQPGVYVYAIEVIFLDKKVLLYRGDVTVIR